MTREEQIQIETLRREVADLRKEMSEGFRELRMLVETRRAEEAKAHDSLSSRVARGEKIDFVIGLVALVFMSLLAHYGVGVG